MKKIILFINILMLFFCLNCKKTPQEMYESVKNEYLKENNNKNRARILDYILDFSLVKKLGKEQIDVNNNTLINNQNKSIIASNGLNLKLKNLPERVLSFYNNKKFFVSDGFKIDIYNIKNEFIDTIDLVKNNKVTIDDFCIAGNKFFYFYKRNLYFSFLNSFKIGKFIDKEFSPPYKKNSFKVDLEIYDNILILCIGRAGAYNISILDLVNKKLIKKDINAATNSFFWGKNILYYIKGASGKWELVSFSIKNDKTVVINSFKNVQNLFFLKKYLVSIYKDKIEIYDYQNNQVYLFFNDIKLIGLIDNSLIVKYLNLYYLVDYDKFFNQLIKVNRDIPGLFI